MTTPIFEHSSEALVFAFRYSSQQYALSPMAKMMKQGAIGKGKGLVSLDGAGQAGLVLQKVGQLQSLHRSCIVARYSLKFEECSCCGGEKMLQEYDEAIANLADWSLQFLTGLSVRGMRRAIIRSFFEKRISLKEVAERLNVPKSSAYDQKAKVWAKLKELDGAAQGHIADLLESMCAAPEAA